MTLKGDANLRKGFLYSGLLQLICNQLNMED